MPHLKELVERHKDDNFALIGINHGDSKKDYKQGLVDYGVTWLSAYQGDSTAITEMYAVQGFPTYLVLDVDGMIVSRAHSKDVDGLVAKLIEKSKK